MSSLGSLSVLIIDDDVRISSLVRDVLKSMGIKNIFVSSDAQRGLQIFKKETMDMVITDWRIGGGMDGLDFIRHVRAAEDSPNRFIPIIMLTGLAERHHVEAARDAGVTEFVVKPFTAKTLLHRVRMIIESPRGFVLSKAYKGPDRRRGGERAPEGKERRKRGDKVDAQAAKKTTKREPYKS